MFRAFWSQVALAALVFYVELSVTCFWDIIRRHLKGRIIRIIRRGAAIKLDFNKQGALPMVGLMLGAFVSGTLTRAQSHVQLRASDTTTNVPAFEVVRSDQPSGVT